MKKKSESLEDTKLQGGEGLQWKEKRHSSRS